MSRPKVAIIRFAGCMCPGYIAKFLYSRTVAWRQIRIDQGRPIPKSAAPYSGLVILGGAVGENANKEDFGPVLDLLRDAIEREVPVMGHCLGGQLLSRALGGSVALLDDAEIGWFPVNVEKTRTAQSWLSPDRNCFDVFQWHRETFSIPPMAERILYGLHCRNQAFVAHGLHLGMQCHLEVTVPMVACLYESSKREIGMYRPSPSVMPMRDVKTRVIARLGSLRRSADRLYGQWIQGLNMNRK